VSLFSGCKKKTEAAELHAFPEGHPDIAKYLHQLSFAHCWCALPYLLTGNSNRSHPSCIRDCEGKFLASHMMLVNLLPSSLCNVCANFSCTAWFISCIQAGIALGELTSLSDLYDTQSVALLFLIGVVSVTPALLGKDEAQEKAPETAVATSWSPKTSPHLVTCTYQDTACGGFIGSCMAYELTGLHNSLAGPWTPSLSIAGLLEICSVIRTLFHSWSLPTLLWVNLGSTMPVHPAKLLWMCRQVACVL
jgi:hypothetical protein